MRISPLYNRFLHSFSGAVIKTIEEGAGRSGYCRIYRSDAYKTIGSAKPISGIIISEYIKYHEK